MRLASACRHERARGGRGVNLLLASSAEHPRTRARALHPLAFPPAPWSGDDNGATVLRFSSEFLRAQRTVSAVGLPCSRPQGSCGSEAGSMKSCGVIAALAPTARRELSVHAVALSILPDGCVFAVQQLDVDAIDSRSGTSAGSR